MHFILFHSFLEMLICLFHDPALHLFSAYLFIIIYIHPVREQQARFTSIPFLIEGITYRINAEDCTDSGLTAEKHTRESSLVFHIHLSTSRYS